MSTARRDQLHQIEADVQKKWEELKVWEVDAPDEKAEKFFCTFPYPYMNGMLHIGHAFTLTKSVFAAQYNRLLGKKVLFPFGFHCTGMPIQAAANNLKREYDKYGHPWPSFPPGRPAAKEDKEGNILVDDKGVTMVFKAPASTGNKAVKVHHIFMKVKGGEFKEVDKVPHPDAETLKEQGKKVICTVPIESGGCSYMVKTELADGTYCPDGNESDVVDVTVEKAAKGAKPGAPPGKRVAKKILAKTGDAAFQWEILAAMGIKGEDMPPFTDPLHWLKYFPPIGMADLKRFGSPIDFRRSFITTSVNPYYDSFVRWQFHKLKEGNKIGFGKRPTIYSETDGQACMDHDRSEGEGVAPQEYTAIKLELVDFPKAVDKLKGKKTFLLAATLRPETMPGQTNCWILPEGEYGCYSAPNNEVYVCSERAARNMSFQDILMPFGKPQLIQKVKGQDLMGCKVKAPTSAHPVVHLLPLPTIKMNKGTGIVTSVPSDSPDDYAAFMDLMKPAKREYFKVKEEWVKPFTLIPIIDVEIDGEKQTLAAQYMCEKLGVASINDRVKLEEAHDVCYTLGFAKGIMSAGPFKGERVNKAKQQFKDKMIKDGQAFAYSEPEKKVVGRSGDECVVAGIDQWYLKYGEESWAKEIKDHLTGPNFNTYNDRIKDSFCDAIGWLKEWACSRSFGLGTQVPWDEKFVIESLSDSTIYMAYYTVCHFLQSDLNGQKSSTGIKPEDMTPEVWDHIFLDGAAPKTKIPKKTLDKMRKEFKFWYPMNLRVSGKDLIQNHLTMSLYNHAAVWKEDPSKWPQGMFCNGWLLVNNEKMSKSKGNFFTLVDIINKYSADAVRMALANSGDTLEPANFEETVCSKSLLFYPVFLDVLEAFVKGTQKVDTGKEDKRFVDRWFANEMNRLVKECKEHYDAMYYREALRTSWYAFFGAFDQYRDICKAGKLLPNKTLVMRYYEWQLIIVSPICPHLAEHGWTLLGKKGTVLDARFPEPATKVDTSLMDQGVYAYDKVPHDFIKLLEKASKNGAPSSATVYVAKNFPAWKVKILEIMRAKHKQGKLPLCTQEDMKDDIAKGQWKDLMADLMGNAELKPFAKHVGPFAAFKRDEAAVSGPSALEESVKFDEVALLKENVEYLKDKLSQQTKSPMDVSVARVEDAPKDHEQAASNAQPGMPAVYYAMPAGAGGAGGGKKGGAAAPAKSKAAAGPAITDMNKLNDLLCRQSYIEGGAGPTQADANQLDATPENVDREKFPHVARWRSHISFFKPAVRAQW